MTHGFSKRCHPLRRPRLFASDLDQERSVVGDNDEIELIFVGAVVEQGRGRTPLDDLGIEIEQAGDVPRVLGAIQREATHLIVASIWEMAGSVTGRGASSLLRPSCETFFMASLEIENAELGDTGQAGVRQRIRKEVRADVVMGGNKYRTSREASRTILLFTEPQLSPSPRCSCSMRRRLTCSNVDLNMPPSSREAFATSSSSTQGDTRGRRPSTGFSVPTQSNITYHWETLPTCCTPDHPAGMDVRSSTIVVFLPAGR